MSNYKNLLLTFSIFICSLAKGQIDTLDQINKIIPIKLLQSLYNSDIDKLKLFCLDDAAIECKEGDLFGVESLTIKTPNYVIYAELSDKLWDKKVVWRFYIKFHNSQNEQLFLKLFPTYLGYHLDGDTYLRDFMQSIAIRDFYKTGKMMIEVWLFYPPLDLDKIDKTSKPNIGSIDFPEKLSKIDFYSIKSKNLFDTIIEENFNNNNRKWDIGAEPKEYSNIIGGNYILKNYDDKNWHWFTTYLPKIRTGLNAKPIFINVNVSPIQSSNSESGIIIGATNTDVYQTKFLLFEFDLVTQTYGLLLYEDNKMKSLIDPTFSTQINKQKTNEFSFYIEKNGIVLIVNNIEVNRYTFSPSYNLKDLGSLYGFYVSPKSEISVSKLSLIQQK